MEDIQFGLVDSRLVPGQFLLEFGSIELDVGFELEAFQFRDVVEGQLFLIKDEPIPVKPPKWFQTLPL